MNLIYMCEILLFELVKDFNKIFKLFSNFVNIYSSNIMYVVDKIIYKLLRVYILINS